MVERKRGEKEDEKKQEKSEKEEEKNRGWSEKWQRDRINAVIWASVLIWAALVILAEATGFANDHFADWWAGWSIFFVGFGSIILLGTLYRMLVPEFRRPVAGGLILGFILLGVGLGDILDSWQYVWVIILISIAFVILFHAFIRRR